MTRWLESHVDMARCWASEQPFAAQEYLDAALGNYFRPPLTGLEWEAYARIYLNQGHISQYLTNDLLAAAGQYEQCYDIYVHQLQEHNDGIAGYLYHQLGNLYTRLGDYERAENLLRRGIDYSKRNHQPDIGKYGDLAIVLVDVGKSREALALINEGLETDLSPKVLVTTHICEARACLQLGDAERAKAALSACPQLISKLDPEATDLEYYWAGYYATLGTIQDSTGDYRQAEINYRKAIQNEINSWETQYRREVGKSYANLGYFYLRQNKPQQALKAFQQTLQCVLRDFKSQSAEEQPQSGLFYAENTIIEGLIGKAEAFKALGALDQALACYELIPIAEAKLRATHAYESSTLLALSESRKRFDTAIAMAWQRYEQTQDAAYIERAFRLTEQARGMLLVQSLARAQAEYRLPDGVRRRDNDLRVRVSWYEQQIAAEDSRGSRADHSKLEHWKNEMLILKHTQEEFIQQLRHDFPDFAHLSDEITFLQVRDVPKLLRADQAMVDYYLTDSDAYIFWLDASGKFTWRQVILSGGFREELRFFAQYPTSWNEDLDLERDRRFRQIGADLFQLLLAPELAASPNFHSLILVPDDALVFVPFEMLLSNSQPAAWADLPWLVVDYNVGYAYSATLLHLQQSLSQQHAQEVRPRYVLGGFAPSYDPERKNRANITAQFQDKVYAVKSTLAEVRKVHRLIGGQDFYGEEASEAQFRLTAPNCRVLLLAMHGFADDQHPELARLLFGNPAPDSINNNILFANELQIMQLHADLAVLSACHTGFGKLNKGEGVYSLARAFAAAGVPCTVMSLWRLQEDTGPAIVETFFKYLQSGKPKDEALRLAKLDFLRNPENAEASSPYYWAGIMVTGDLRAMDLPPIPETGRHWPFLLLGGVVLGGGWWWLRRRKRGRFET
ncbi:MAG: CHAT domain-containing protein [Saprospiraceae bacterium]